MLHLQRQLPVAFAEEVIKRDCQNLKEAVKVVQGLERAHQIRVMRPQQPEQVVSRVVEGQRAEGHPERSEGHQQQHGSRGGFGRPPPPRGQRGGQSNNMQGHRVIFSTLRYVV